MTYTKEYRKVVFVTRFRSAHAIVLKQFFCILYIQYRQALPDLHKHLRVSAKKNYESYQFHYKKIRVCAKEIYESYQLHYKKMRVSAKKIMKVINFITKNTRKRSDLATLSLSHLVTNCLDDKVQQCEHKTD